MNARQIVITILLALGVSVFSWFLFSEKPKPVVDNELLAHQQFIVTQLIPAHGLLDNFGIPPSIPVAIAAMTSEFGENELVSGSNAYFLLQCDEKGTYKADTVFIGSLPIRAYSRLSLAYVDWATNLMNQDFYPLVKGQPAEKWFPYLDKWGYGVKDFYDNYPEIQQIDSLLDNNITHE